MAEESTKESALDELISAFIEGHSSFQRFSRGIERHFSRFPEQRKEALRRLEAMKAAGDVTDAIYGLIVQEIERGSSGDITPPLEEGEESPPPEAIEEEPEIRAVPRDEVDVPSSAWADIRHGPARRTPRIEPRPRSEPKVSAPPRPPPQPPQPPPPPPPAEPASPKAGTVLGGRYRLMTQLGHGGMSLVFAAEDMRREGTAFGAAHVCVKLLAPEYAGREDARRGLEREAQLLGRLNHPGIVRMLDFHADDPWPFLVMELLDGERLRDLLVRHGATPIPPERAVKLLHDLAEILAYLHSRGLVHRDFKPANIFVTTAGRARLFDFGLAADAARFEDGGDLASKSWTPIYASPEMLAGRSPEPRDDVYALGCVAYELLTGRHPWDKLPADIAARRKLKATRPAGLARPRWNVLRRALSFNGVERPADAAAFLAEFFQPAGTAKVSPWATAAVLSGIAALVAWFVFAPGERPDGDAEPPSFAVPSPVEEPPLGTGPGAEDQAGLPDAPAVPEESVAADAPADEIPSPPLVILVPDVPTEAEDAAPVAEAPAVAAEAEPPPVAAEEEPAPAAAAPEPAAPATLALSASSFRVMEGGGALRLRLQRPAGHDGPLRVLWRTEDESARHDEDYIGSPAWRLAEVPAGVNELLILIPIVDDSLPGPDRTFYVELRETSGGPTVGTPARALVTIVDDD